VVALWTLKEAETQVFIFFINELKVPTDYCMNPKRLLNMRELKFNYSCMKAHGYHVIMTQLLYYPMWYLPPPKGPHSNHKVVLILQRDLTKGHLCVQAGPDATGHSRNSLQTLILVHLIIHYGTQRLCRVSLALGKGLNTLGKTFVECHTW